MRENTSRTSTRWGGKFEQDVVGFSTVDVEQFVDMKLLAPQQLSLALYALADVPIVGLSVQWIIHMGVGSFNLVERFGISVSDFTAQIPVLISRPANSIGISARIFSVVPETKLVRLRAFVAPQSPTWTTDLSCQTAGDVFRYEGPSE